VKILAAGINRQTYILNRQDLRSIGAGLYSSAHILMDYFVLWKNPKMGQCALYRTRGICSRPRFCQSWADAGFLPRAKGNPVAKAEKCW
jgi:hypothetical protein